MGTKYHFNPETCHQNIVNWVKQWFDENGKGCNAVIGISGGKDSTIAAAVCVEALGKDRVFGVLMPNGQQADIEDSYRVVDTLEIPYIIVNIKDAVDSVKESILHAKGNCSNKPFDFTKQAEFNLPPRIRMSTLYAASQCKNGRVVNTCNLSETLLGWETRWGDAVGDFSPFANLTKSEVVALGKTWTNLPIDLVTKTPGDGLCGKDDETAFGFTYDVLDQYIRTGEIDDADIKKIIDQKIKNNLFKHSPIPSFIP